MLQTVAKKTEKGDCEASHFDGKGVNCDITLVHGNMWLCADCLLKEQLAEASSTHTVIQARKVDTLLELKQDVFVAGTVSFSELQASIMNDASVPEDKKWVALVQEADRRIQKMTEVIFADEAALVEKKNMRQAFHVNVQQIIGKLSKEEREKHKQYDVNYVVGKPGKKEKTTKPVKPSKKQPYNKKEAMAVSEKYGVPFMQVVGLSTSRNLTYIEAAHYFLDLMGLPIPE